MVKAEGICITTNTVRPDPEYVTDAVKYPELTVNWHALNPLTVTVVALPVIVYAVALLASVHVPPAVLRPELPRNHSARGVAAVVGTQTKLKMELW